MLARTVVLLVVLGISGSALGLGGDVVEGLTDKAKTEVDAAKEKAMEKGKAAMAKVKSKVMGKMDLFADKKELEGEKAEKFDKAVAKCKAGKLNSEADKQKLDDVTKKMKENKLQDNQADIEEMGKLFKKCMGDKPGEVDEELMPLKAAAMDQVRKRGMKVNAAMSDGDGKLKEGMTISNELNTLMTMKAKGVKRKVKDLLEEDKEQLGVMMMDLKNKNSKEKFKSGDKTTRRRIGMKIAKADIKNKEKLELDDDLEVAIPTDSIAEAADGITIAATVTPMDELDDESKKKVCGKMVGMTLYKFETAEELGVEGLGDDDRIEICTDKDPACPVAKMFVYSRKGDATELTKDTDVKVESDTASNKDCYKTPHLSDFAMSEQNIDSGSNSPVGIALPLLIASLAAAYFH